MRIWEYLVATEVKGAKMSPIICINGEEFDFDLPRDIIWQEATLGDVSGYLTADHERYIKNMFKEYIQVYREETEEVEDLEEMEELISEINREEELLSEWLELLILEIQTVDISISNNMFTLSFDCFD